MSVVLGFLPFIIFAISSSTHGPLHGLIAGAITAAGLLFINLKTGRSPKTLDVGSLVLFAALAAYVFLTGGNMSLFAVRFWTDIGLFAIVALSILIGKPFTEQYARESVNPKFWDSPVFHRKNVIISAFWAVAFLIMAFAEYLVAYTPGFSQTLGTVIVVAAVAVSITFTKWYSKA